jgi:excisionase family DNA binding protein
MDQRVEHDRAALLEALFGQQLPNGAGERLLRTSDVALLFQVSERTVSEWARRGRVPSVRTPGGHRRYPAEQIRHLFVQGRNGNSNSNGNHVLAGEFNLRSDTAS